MLINFIFAPPRLVLGGGYLCPLLIGLPPWGMIALACSGLWVSLLTLIIFIILS